MEDIIIVFNGFVLRADCRRKALRLGSQNVNGRSRKKAKRHASHGNAKLWIFSRETIARRKKEESFMRERCEKRLPLLWSILRGSHTYVCDS